MQKKYLILIAVVIIGVFSIFFLNVNAQVKNESVVVNLNPAAPRANENVTVLLSSIAIDLTKAKISWMLNGQTVIEKVGQKSFSFNAGSTGTKKTLEINIETVDGNTVNKSIVVTPTDIDMLVEGSNTYVPPFYKGRILPSAEGFVKVVAMPNSNTLGGLSYDWSQDGDNMSDSSGYNKNVYVYKNSYLEKNNAVSVLVTDLSKNSIGEGSTMVTPTSPKIVFYKYDPIFGTLWDNAISDKHLVDNNGEVLVVEPYYIWPKNLNSNNLNFKWSIAGNDVPNQNPKNEMGIKPEAGQSGQTKISVVVENINSLFLNITKDLNVNF